MESEKELQKRQNTALFINTTQKIIEKEGLEQLSIRKIADKAGFHNSTIYLYFKDLDELLMVASVKYFQDYSQSLEKLSQKNSSPVDTFISIWDLFCDSIFQKPDIYYNFFFGKRSDNLKPIMEMYYDVFPEERNSFSSIIESMYFGSNIIERSLKILTPLISENTNVNDDNVDMINDIVVSFCKCKLEQKCKDRSLDSRALKNSVHNMIDYVCGIKR